MPEKKKSILRQLFESLGPGYITGAADDDPSGIATYSQTGVLFGFSQLWVALFSFPFMAAIQEMCARIGVVTGKGLSGVIKQYYSKKVLFAAVFLLLVANVINIGADLGAMAASVQLLVTLPFTMLIISITAFTILVEVFVPYRVYAKFLKYLALSLLAYVATAFIIKQDWRLIAYSTFVPSFVWSRDYLFNIVAFMGTTISPYLFFWQANEEVEEELVHGQMLDMGKGIPNVGSYSVHKMRIDTIFGMFFSNLMTFFIIVTVASTLGAAGVHTVDTAADAANALRPLAGDFAFLLFTLGILGTGLLAVPILAGSAAYAIAEVFDWEEGLGKKFNEARGFYGVIAIATLVGLMVNFSPIGPITMLYYAAMLNGVLAPPLMVIILLISNNEKILGDKTNGILSNFLGITITTIMSCVATALIYTML